MKQKSKFLSLVLRHKPDAIGITLDTEGWVPVETLLSQAAKHGTQISRDELNQIVAESDKKRFTLSQNGTHIRAAQGHSVPVNPGYLPVTPPEQLFHGTATKNLTSIRAEGLKPGARLQVHLSATYETAVQVGQRHGKPHVFCVASGQMVKQGFAFYQADNGVWLTDHIPPEFLSDFR